VYAYARPMSIRRIAAHKKANAPARERRGVDRWKGLALYAASLWGTAAVVRHWRYVADERDAEASCLECAEGAFATGAWAFDEHGDAADTVVHGAACCFFGCELCSEGR
jgi:hypothetical protein